MIKKILGTILIIIGGVFELFVAFVIIEMPSFIKEGGENFLSGLIFGLLFGIIGIFLIKTGYRYGFPKTDPYKDYLK